MEWRKFYIVTGIFLAMILLPYLCGFAAQGNSLQFGGFLLNPIDGNSYLAKMYQGWNGNWLFHLSYTPEKGPGNFLFLFYLFLGQFSRWTGLSLLATFHIVRLIGASLLLFTLRTFCLTVFGTNADFAWKAFLLTVFGSGVGWLAALGGAFTSDFWVAEAYPFLAAYANPHFPFGLAMMLVMMTTSLSYRKSSNYLWLFLLGILLAIIMPFGVIVVGLVLAGTVLWTWIETRKLDWLLLLTIFAGGGSLVGYQYWETMRDPLLRMWNSQNVTPAPPAWDLLVSLFPALLLAGIGIYAVWKYRKNQNYKILIVWLLAGLALIYLPFNLQRRFMLGIYIPAAMLGIVGMGYLLENRPTWRKWLWKSILSLSVVTNLVVLLAGGFGALGHSPKLFFSNDELKAFEWVKKATASDAVILASSDTGLLLPAHTGRSVFYGHPFESIQAYERKKEVADYFSGSYDFEQARQFLIDHKIDYIYYGVREKVLGIPAGLEQNVEQYSDGNITIYKVTH